MSTGRSSQGTHDTTKYLSPAEQLVVRRYCDDEIAAALARGNTRRLRDAVVGHVLIGSGLRRFEVAALVVGDLVLSGHQPHLVVRHGKGGKRRDVTIGPELRKVLRRYLEARTVRGGALDAASALFTVGGRAMSNTSVWRAWKRTLRATGLDIRGRGCHVARHGRGTSLFAATKDIKLTATELGHSDIRTSMIYVHTLPEDRIAAAAKVEHLTEELQQKPTKRSPK